MDLKKSIKQITKLSNNNTAATFAFNSAEAEMARQWQTAMSNTSHQREVADLKAAGLNPVLSANQGAASYSAATASGNADASNTAAAAQMMMNNENNAVSLRLGKMQYRGVLASAAAARDAAAMTAGATMAAAATNAAAARDVANTNQATTLANSIISGRYNTKVARINQESSKYNTDYSRNGSFFGALSSLFNQAQDYAQGPRKNATYRSKF